MTPSDKSPDVETSSDDYARRFAGPVGAWFLELQAASVVELLTPIGRGSRVLDVGGGHAQIAPVLRDAGYDLIVVGSDRSCGRRLGTGNGMRFEVANLLELPHADRSFDAVVSLRLLPHFPAWERLLLELCRAAGRCVIVDYPSIRSVNVLADSLFAWKKRVEGNTRPFRLFRPSEIRAMFEGAGFRVTASRPQFFFPMVLHRVLGSARATKALEAPCSLAGLTRVFGSPIIARAERR